MQPCTKWKVNLFCYICNLLSESPPLSGQWLLRYNHGMLHHVAIFTSHNSHGFLVFLARCMPTDVRAQCMAMNHSLESLTWFLRPKEPWTGASSAQPCHWNGWRWLLRWAAQPVAKSHRLTLAQSLQNIPTVHRLVLLNINTKWTCYYCTYM